MARTKPNGANLPVPQNRDEAAESVKRLGELMRQFTRLEADMNDELAAAKARFEAQAEPIRTAIGMRTEGLRIWAEANRQTLTGGERTKTVDLGTGLLKWRLRPPSVKIKGVDGVIARLRELGLGRFLRTKTEIDKEAIGRDPAAVKGLAGITVGSEGEDFVVEPFEEKLAEGGAS